ncbi:hypothetical protein BHE97_07275 [Aeromicrobium sp. PE09-221]|uniref:hypothetical protein n=1 Tax=Aeromicrobium sp. PE09-221 TaxID=1898043 RepID=UPI000B3E898B|nr:hypothetical protein [Aeromicrobium sp. PE09-221]OUZ10550.1 hypothetical protein BHE97_07275 [Aeromicrobium sp. PE09-221]
MRTRSLQISKRSRRAGALAAVIVGGALIAPSQAAPDADPPALLQPMAGTADARYPGEDEVPPPGSISQTMGTVTNSQGTVVNNSRMYITNGQDNPIWGGLYFGEYNRPVEDPEMYLPSCIPSTDVPCVPNPFYQPECATSDPATQLKGQYQRHRMYPMGPLEGGGADVGLLTQMKVNMVAFGSVPATATLTMRSPRISGEVQPFYIHLWDSQVTRSTAPRRASSCDPDFRAPGAQVSSLVEGQIEVTLSDLVVDGVPVDVGPACRTEHAAEIDLWAEFDEGYYTAAGGGPLGAYDGLHPGSIIPLDHPLYFGAFDGRDIPASAGIDVPAFTGCGTGGDDLSPLVTAMASGPNNPVRAVQGPLISLNEIPWDDFTRCTQGGGQLQCPLPGPETPEMPPLPWEEN